MPCWAPGQPVQEQVVVAGERLAEQVLEARGDEVAGHRRDELREVPEIHVGRSLVELPLQEQPWHLGVLLQGIRHRLTLRGEHGVRDRTPRIQIPA